MCHLNTRATRNAKGRAKISNVYIYVKWKFLVGRATRMGEKYCVKSTLWNTPNQVELDTFLSKISEVQDMYKLEG